MNNKIERSILELEMLIKEFKAADKRKVTLKGKWLIRHVRHLKNKTV